MDEEFKKNVEEQIKKIEKEKDKLNTDIKKNIKRVNVLKKEASNLNKILSGLSLSPKKKKEETIQQLG